MSTNLATVAGSAFVGGSVGGTGSVRAFRENLPPYMFVKGKKDVLLRCPPPLLFFGINHFYKTGKWAMETQTLNRSSLSRFDRVNRQNFI